MKVIDLSYANGAVDFDAVKRSGIEGVIIRAGYGRCSWQTDRQFERNYAEAKRVGLHVGCYWYSYSDSVADSVDEANACLDVISGKQFDLPVYYDVEEKCVVNGGFCRDAIFAFCGMLEEHGYFAGVYSSKSVLTDIIGADIGKRFAVWLAWWCSLDVDAVKTNYGGDFGCWQYSESGRVIGIIGNVDLDVMTVDYPSVIIGGGFNGYPKSNAENKNDTVDENAEKQNESVGTVEKPVETVEKQNDVETYTIVSGDTLSGIAKKYRTTVKKLMQLNSDKITDPDVIYAGDVILVPGGRLK